MLLMPASRSARWMQAVGVAVCGAIFPDIDSAATRRTHTSMLMCDICMNGSIRQASHDEAFVDAGDYDDEDHEDSRYPDDNHEERVDE